MKAHFVFSPAQYVQALGITGENSKGGIMSRPQVVLTGKVWLLAKSFCLMPCLLRWDWQHDNIYFLFLPSPVILIETLIGSVLAIFNIIAKFTRRYACRGEFACYCFTGKGIHVAFCIDASRRNSVRYNQVGFIDLY